MHEVHLKGEKEPITVSDDELAIIKQTQAAGLSGIWIGDRYIAMTSIRLVGPGVKQNVPALNAGLDMSPPIEFTVEERKRKMKIMMDAYLEARNEIRAGRGEPPLTEVEIPPVFKRVIAVI